MRTFRADASTAIRPKQTPMEYATDIHKKRLTAHNPESVTEHVDALILACDYLLSMLYFATVHEVKHTSDSTTAKPEHAEWHQFNTWTAACKHVHKQLLKFARQQLQQPAASDQASMRYIQRLLTNIAGTDSIVTADILTEMLLNEGCLNDFEKEKVVHNVDASLAMQDLLKTIELQYRSTALPQACATGQEWLNGLVKFFADKLLHIGERDSQQGDHRKGFTETDNIVYGLLLLRDPAPLVLVRMMNNTRRKKGKHAEDKRSMCMEFVSLLRKARRILQLGATSFGICVDTGEKYSNLNASLEEPFRPSTAQGRAFLNSNFLRARKCKGVDCQSKVLSDSGNTPVSCRYCSHWLCSMQCLVDQHPQDTCKYAYTALDNQPLLLVVVEKGRMGDRFPDSLWCMDHRIKATASNMAMLVQVLGRLSRFPTVHTDTIVHALGHTGSRDHMAVFEIVKAKLVQAGVDLLDEHACCTQQMIVQERACAGVCVKVEIGKHGEQLQLIVRRYYITTPVHKEPERQKMMFEVMKVRLPHVLLPAKQLALLTKAVDAREEAIQTLISKSAAANKQAVEATKSLAEADNTLLLMLRNAAMRMITFEEAVDLMLDEALILPDGVELNEELALCDAHWNEQNFRWDIKKIPRRHEYSIYAIKPPGTSSRGTPNAKHYDDRALGGIKHALRLLYAAYCQSGTSGMSYSLHYLVLALACNVCHYCIL
jgi:hypothetical protein